VARKMSLVRRYLSTDAVFLEIGPGDCSFAFEVARHVKEVYAVDVSAEISRRTASPANFRLILSDGCTVPAPEHAITIAYSNQLMEHLHPDDALEQLRNIYRVLAPGGAYICITPNRVSGPHDVSGHFDPVACGLHLREYSYAELSQLLKSVGFSKLVGYVGGRGLYARFPMALLLAGEWVLKCLPLRLRQRIARSIPGRGLLGITLVAIRA
jgi:ubiquinone/menaquinone biosynthesis C-methylase UbiE